MSVLEAGNEVFIKLGRPPISMRIKSEGEKRFAYGLVQENSSQNSQ